MRDHVDQGTVSELFPRVTAGHARAVSTGTSRPRPHQTNTGRGAQTLQAQHERRGWVTGSGVHGPSTPHSCRSRDPGATHAPLPRWTSPRLLPHVTQVPAPSRVEGSQQVPVLAGLGPGLWLRGPSPAQTSSWSPPLTPCGPIAIAPSLLSAVSAPAASGLKPPCLPRPPSRASRTRRRVQAGPQQQGQTDGKLGVHSHVC